MKKSVSVGVLAAFFLSAFVAASCGGGGGGGGGSSAGGAQAGGANSAAALRSGAVEREAIERASGPRFDAEDGRFGISLPAGFDAFREKRETQTSPVGRVESHYLNSQNARGLCMLEYHDMPGAVFEGRDMREALEDTRDEMLKRMNAATDREEKITVQGHPGLSVRGFNVANEQTGYFRFDYVVVPPRLYRVGFVSRGREELDKPDIEAFFESFRLTK